MVSVGQGACRGSTHDTMALIGCSQSRSETQGLSACIGDDRCGAMDWDPAANQTCLWRGVSPGVHAVESACGHAPHPAGCRCYKKSPLPSPPPPPPPPGNCTSDDGCQLNGVCKNPGLATGSCECADGWRGLDCVRRSFRLRSMLSSSPTYSVRWLQGELDIIPGPRPPDSGLLLNGSAATRGILSTWGGAIVQDNEDNNTWHMYAAAMLGGCGIKQWKTNSESAVMLPVVCTRVHCLGGLC